MSGTNPVRWWVWDGACPTLPPGSIPPAHDPSWEARYDNESERGKRTTRRLSLPGVLDLYDSLTGRASLTEWSLRLGYLVGLDHHMHGGGLHVTAPGGHLDCHLDYDLHPKKEGWRRALNVIAFLHPEWREGWGGQLYLADPMGEAVVAFDPKPGRVVAFEVGDLSYHGVRPTSPDAAERVSLAVHLLSRATTANTRRRALFLPHRGCP